MELQKILKNDLPLQTESSYFILANVMDIFLTFLLLYNGAIEANPIANAVLQKFGFHSLIWYKLWTVAAVCVIAQLVATRRPNTARFLLITGTVLVSAVVIHSIRLYWINFRLVDAIVGW